MASIVVSGDTSGAVTITAPAIAGTTTLTLPTTSGTLVVTGGAQTIEFADGTVSAPSITNSGDTNTGIYFPAADTIAFTEGGVESMRIDSSGNVGIGLTSVGNRLVISQPVSTSFGTGGTYIGLGNTENAIGQTVLIGFGYRGSSTNEYPAVMGYLATNNGGNQAGALVFGTRDVTTNTAPTERMRIDSSGNVGIGASSFPADTNLTVLGNFQTGFYRNVTSGARGYFLNIGAKTSGGFADGAYVFGAVESGDATGYLTFGTRSGGSTGERMRITSDGEVCVNATSAYGSARFYVNAPQPTAANWWVSTLRTASTSTATTMIAFIDGSNDFCGQVYIEPTTNSTVFSTSSDYRLKDNVAPMTDALAKVQALNPVTYTWKKSGKTGQGFIAHELQEIVPECVVGEKDAMRTYIDEEGNEQTAILPQMVDTSFLVATLTAAIQELNAKVEAQAAEIQALKGAR